MKKDYLIHVDERVQQGLPPLPLTAKQVNEIVKLLIADEDSQFYLDLLTNRVPPGVDEAAFVKASFLTAVAKGEQNVAAIDKQHATFLLGTMLGGYNVNSLIDLLDDDDTAANAYHALANTLLIYEAYQSVVDKAKNNQWAEKVLNAWLNANWFLNKPALPEVIKLTVFRVDGEINTDDLSPAREAWSRPDIPLHAKSMLVKQMPDGLRIIEELKREGRPLAFVGDVVGTGSSRKSAINSVLWHMGNDIDFVPNKKTGSVILGGKIAPIFFNTAQDSGAMPIECDVSKLKMGDEIHIHPYAGKITCAQGKTLSEFSLKPETLSDEVRAGGRVALIIGRGLTDKARDDLKLPVSDVFIRPQDRTKTNKGYTLAQKIVGRACGVSGIRPGTYCEPIMATVGSQDTTGAMTRDELKELACLGFSADLVMQSFCHTAAYPKPVDVQLQHSLPAFMVSRGGVSLRPGDGIIHSWLNRMLLPDTVGTGGDSHTRFPIGISFPAGSGLVAFGASLGVLPLDMPESVLVRFAGTMQPGVTLRDLVNAIPYYALKKGLLTLDKEGKINVFSGRVLEIEGLPDLKVEQAFELADASAERSANGCTIALSEDSVAEYLRSNIVLLSSLINAGYEDKKTLARRINKMQQWLDSPQLLQADKDCQYTTVIEIDMNEIKEPLLACPNDPDDIKTLSDISGERIDEVFIGSCMTNIGHFRAASRVLENVDKLATTLWVSPPTRMDEAQLKKEGYYKVFERLNANLEIPGCSLCMGNQARVEDNATVVSTSTRNFPNRLGDGANVYLSSAELAAVAAKLGKIPTLKEYQQVMAGVGQMSADIYRYLNFNELPEYTKEADQVQLSSLLTS